MHDPANRRWRRASTAVLIRGVAHGASATALFRHPRRGVAFRSGGGPRAHRAVRAEPAVAAPGTGARGDPGGAHDPPRAADRGRRRLSDRRAADPRPRRTGHGGGAAGCPFHAQPAGGSRRCQLRLDVVDPARGAAAVPRSGDPPGRGRCAGAVPTAGGRAAGRGDRAGLAGPTDGGLGVVPAGPARRARRRGPPLRGAVRRPGGHAGRGADAAVGGGLGPRSSTSS